ncbi:putative Armadillo/beta-catenin-like repeat protein [Cryptosporidium bovis]|uniref:putative Armadillo/beta-catenin-like repeat protein n=1 Tax=Cryptosporidium bovis TaxID=310047 RepID=UPI00351AA828|nr:putative Armadillo/beta-catenin-like repeat protein [Cryptosporidium bovis]
MAVTRTQRAPDNGVATAISSANQHKKFKRMLLFSLRSLSDLCVPPTLLYKENSLDAIQRGVLELMSEALQQFPDDEDISMNCVRIVFGISEFMKEAQDSEIINMFISGNGSSIISLAINSLIETNESCLVPIICSTIENLFSVNAIDAEVAAATLGKFFESKYIGNSEMIRVTSAICSIAQSEVGAVAFAQSGVGTKALSFAHNWTKTDNESAILIENCLEIVKLCASNGDAPEDALKALVHIIDLYRNRRGVAEKGGACLEMFMNPQKLMECLVVIKSPTSDISQKDDALTMLSAMAYVSSFADEIVRQGGISLVVEALNQGVSEYSQSSDEEHMNRSGRVIVGSLRVLARVASNPSNVDTLISSGGIDAICASFTTCISNLEISTAVCQSLYPLFVRETTAVAAASIMGDLLQLFYANVENDKDFTKCAADLLSIASQHAPLAEALISVQSVEIVATCLNYYCDDAAYQAASLSTLNHLAPFIKSLQPISEFGGISGIEKSIMENVNDETLVTIAIQLVEKLSNVSESAIYLSQGEMVNAILEAMLVHNSNEYIQKAGLNILEVIATDKDVTLHTSNLPKVALSDPNAAYKDLAAIAGLCKISTLTPLFSSLNICGDILNYARKWISENPFEGQERLVSAAFQTTSTLKISEASGDLGPTIVQLLDIAAMPQMKTFAEKNTNDNPVVENMKAVRSLTEVQRIGSDEVVVDVVNSLVSTIRKYIENRVVQLQCIKSFCIIGENESGARAEIENGVIKVCLAFLQRTKVLVDCQIAGFTLLTLLIKYSPDAIEILRKSGAIEIVQGAMRLHNRNSELRLILAPLALALVPVTEIKKIISEKVGEIKISLDSGDLKTILQALTTCNELAVTPEGCKFVTSEGIPALLPKIEELASSKLNTEEAILAQNVLCAMATLSSLISTSRVGKVALVKSNVILTLLNIYKNLSKCTFNEEIETGIVDDLVVIANLVRFDMKVAETSFDNGAVQLICTSLDSFQENERILGSACSAIAAMATSPKRVEGLLAEPSFNSLLARLVNAVNMSSKSEVRIRCLNAINDLISSHDTSLIQITTDVGSIVAALGIIDRYPSETQQIRSACRVLNFIGNYVDIRAYFEQDLHRCVEVVLRAIDAQKNNDECIEDLLVLLNNLTNSEDNTILRECAIVELMQNVMMVHNDNPEVISKCGEVLSKCGADETIKSLMISIINTQQENGPDCPRELDQLCRQLAVFVTAQPENPEDALQYTEACLQSLVAAAAEYPDDVRLLSSIAVLTQRITDRAFDNSEDSFGSWAVATSGMMQYIEDNLEDMSGKAVSTKRYVCSGIRVLSGCLNNPYTRNYVLERCNNGTFLPHICEIFDKYQNDPEVVAEIYEFLRVLAEDSVGAQYVAQTPIGDISNIIFNIKKHRKNDTVSVEGMNLIGNLVVNAGVDSALICSINGLNELQGLTEGSLKSDIRDATLCNLMTKLVSSSHEIEDKSLVSRQIRRCRAYDDDQSLNETRREGVAVAVSKLIGASVAVSDKAKIQGIDSPAEILSVIQTYPTSAEVVRESAKALTPMIKVNENASSLVLSSVLPILGTSSLQVIGSDPYAADAVADMMLTLAKIQGMGVEMSQQQVTDDLLNSIMQLGDYYGDEFGQGLKAKVEEITSTMAADVPTELSLKVVYEMFKRRESEGLSLSCTESTLIMEKMEYLSQTMSQYVAMESMEGPIENDFKYGCMAVQLISNIQENVDYLVDNTWPKTMLLNLSNHNIETKNSIISALIDISKSEKSAIQCATTSGAAQIMCDLVQEIHSSTTLEGADREEKLVLRLQFVEKITVSRQLFLGSNMLDILLSIWDAIDNKQYNLIVLRNVFRALRRIVSDEFVSILLNANVLKRLISIIKAKTDIGILPDVLYLLGSLAIIPSIKTDIGESGGIEFICELLKASIKMPPEQITPTVTNGCLALANLTIQHTNNKMLFIKSKGPEIIKSLFTAYTGYWDVINSLGVLIVNLGYKKDETKKELGTSGIPAVIVQFLNKYNGEQERVATRAFMSVLKAVANLCLFTPNISIFASTHIESVFDHLLKVSIKLPKETILMELRTLCNIASENESSQLSAFGILIKPLIDLIINAPMDDPDIKRLCFDVLSMLCRSQNNSKEFHANGGTDIVIKQLLKNDYDNGFTISAIHLLSLQTNVQEQMEYMISAGIYRVIIGIIEGKEGSSDLKIAAFRLLRRCVADPSNALDFIATGGAQSICESIKNSSDQTLVLVEAIRVLLGLLYCGSPDLEYSSSDAPKGYQVCQMDANDCSGIVKSINHSIHKEENGRHLRLMRAGFGILVYLLSENLCIESIASTETINVMSKLMTLFGSDGDSTALICQYIVFLSRYALDLIPSIVNDEFRNSLESSASKVKGPKKDFINSVSAALTSADYTSLPMLCDNFNFDITHWNVEPYPNGVQDLPKETKDFLRNGGKLKIVMDGKLREDFIWRASQDLYKLEWKIGSKDTEYSNTLPIVKVRNIWKGLQSNVLKSANIIEPRKITGPTCFVIVGPPSEDQPQGMEISLKTKSKSERDSMIESLVMWREAATCR